MQLHEPEERIHFRDPPTIAKVVVQATVIHTSLALVAERPCQILLFVVISGDHAALASGHDLGRKEREGGGIGQIAGFHAPKLAAMGVGGIFHNEQPLAPAVLDNGWKFGRNDSADMDPEHTSEGSLGRLWPLP